MTGKASRCRTISRELPDGLTIQRLKLPALLHPPALTGHRKIVFTIYRTSPRVSSKTARDISATVNCNRKELRIGHNQAQDAPPPGR